MLASRQGKSILKATRLNFEKSVFFLDSKIALAWICGEARGFKPFVSVRVGEIQNNSDPAHWRHIPGELNVADDVSRGIPVESLVGRWQHGPDILQSSPVADPVEVEKEHRKIHVVCEQTKAQPPTDCKKISNWKRLVRVTAYTLRFIGKLRGSTMVEGARKLKDGLLSPQELQKHAG